jgi:hypothetical protein
MGACDSSDQEKPRKIRYVQEEIIQRPNPEKQESNYTQNYSPKRGIENVNKPNQIDEEAELDNRDDILRRGNKKELQIMVDVYPDDIDEYSFDKKRTLLLEACIVCPNHCIIDMIMEKRADIDKEELQTGNTAIFLSALYLKVSFVRELLKYHPNLQHRNHANQDIFQFLNNKLIEQRKNIGRDLTYDEHEKYEQIINMLKEQINI